ncbi:hypothetical protein [Flavobacterium akiainvivens]|nr:hypothetical protein [Flavobacterium akiainvivens]SFQ37113.1 hypothetical protein SAMN05444144_103325 [Flavobacterium akiainvivens]
MHQFNNIYSNPSLDLKGFSALAGLRNDLMHIKQVYIHSME